MIKYLLFFMAFISTQALADSSTDNVVMDGGLGVFHSAEKSVAETKFFKIGLQEPVWYALQQRFNLGFWLDNAGNGRNNSGFTGYQLGYQVDTEQFEASIWCGPSLITSPDVLLGSIFEFNETVFFGIHDKMGQTIGFSYNHFSDAGLTATNIGRDFGAIEIKFPF